MTALNPSKACGPDGIPNWMLKEYAECLSFPISRIINLYLNEQSLPKIWKFADVSPLPIKGEASWRAEEAAQACLPYSMSIERCRAVRNSRLRKACSSGSARPKPIWSCSQFLNHPGADTHASQLVQGTDGNGATARAILFDYKKAFDLIDHRILVEKLCRLNLPTRIINWIIDFLSNRSQRIKLSEGCYSEWGSAPSGVPQGTKLGLWPFLVLINDLDVVNLHV